jgi:Prenyltransferase and squalene oxidase repeat
VLREKTKENLKMKTIWVISVIIACTLPCQVKASDTMTFTTNGVLRNRGPEARVAALVKYGGGAETEKAVLRALRWFVTLQEKDGSWGKGKPAMTALVLLAYLGHGETLTSSEFGPVIESGVRFLVDSQEVDGHFKGRDGHDYTQPIVAYALAEAYAMTGDDRARKAAIHAVSVIVKGQNPSGGFNYNLKASDRNDTSYMAWCTQAMWAAQVAGLSTEIIGLERAMESAVDGFRQNYAESESLGGFGYTGPNVSSGLGLSGAGAYSMQLLGKAQSKEVCNTLPAIAKNYPFDWKSEKGLFPIYYWYYNTSALFHKGGAAWDAWNKQFSSALVNEQVSTGRAFYEYQDSNGQRWKTGYWKGSKDVSFSSELLDTILCTLMLEVYYRYTPITQSN